MPPFRTIRLLAAVTALLLASASVPASAVSASGSVIFELDEDDGRLPPPPLPPPPSPATTGPRHRQIGRLDVGHRTSSSSLTSLIRYTLLRAPGDTLASQFAVAPGTGVLSYVGARLDRESFCASAGTCCDARPVCVIPLSVRAINTDAPDSSRSLRVEIHIRDVNDNAPGFPGYSPPAEFRLVLDENAHQGEEFALPAAADPDATGNSVEDYELVGETAGHFQLRKFGGVGSRLEPRLLVTKPLDRERTPELRFTLVALDGGDPRLSGRLDIVVRVNDKNDETPRFHLDGLQPPLTVRLPETHPVGPGRPFLMLNATDADAGLNARLRYRLRNQRGPSPFFVNPASGAVSLARPLDYERSAVHTLVAEAVDRDGGFASGGVAPRTGSVTLTVSVVDVNDEAPVIALTSLSPDGQLSIDENKPPDSLVAWLTVSDADSGIRGVDCHLGARGDDDSFRLVAKPGATAELEEFELRTSRQLDAEVTPAVNLTVVCTDRGHPPLTSHRNLRVIVNNLNDNAPAFKLTAAGPPLRVSAPENQRPGWLVCSLNATDADGDAVQFELLEFGQTPFRLDERTGRLFATESFDRELVNEYHLRVRVTDLGKPPRSSPPLELVVTVSDVNDNPPSFRPGTVYEFSVSESASPGQQLGVIRAEDPDAGPNGQIQYRLAEFAARRRFRLDPDTGQLATATALDRELDGPRHSFTAWAVDKGVPQRTATVQVTVLVTDSNDNPPRFMFPGQPNTTIDSSFRNPAGATVAELQATDPDEGPNSELVYSLLGGTGGDRFSVDPITGRLYAARNLDSSDSGVYQLRLSVRDRGQPSLSAEVDLRVALLNLPPEKARQQPANPENQPQPPLLPQPPSTSAAGDRGKQNSFADGGGGGGSLGRRGLLLLGCLAVPAAILAVVCLVLLLLARGRSRLGLRRAPASATGISGGCVGGKPDIRLIVGGVPMSRFDCPASAAAVSAATAGTPSSAGGAKLLLEATGDCEGRCGEFKAARHCPTLPMPQPGEGHRAQTLLRLGGGQDISNTYYRIPASDDDSGYDRGVLARATDVAATASPATIDGRRGRRGSSGQQQQQPQQQPPAYQTLMQHQHQLRHQSSFQSGSAVATGRRTDSQKRQFHLVSSSFV